MLQARDKAPDQLLSGLRIELASSKAALQVPRNKLPASQEKLQSAAADVIARSRLARRN
jgi:hypothetical protein